MLCENISKEVLGLFEKVLILVLMEDALRVQISLEYL